MSEGYERIRVAPISGALGAEVSNVSLRDMDDATFQEVLRAWGQHVVLFFRDQHLAPMELETLAGRFGELTIAHFYAPMEGTSYINRLEQKADAPLGSRVIGDRWHADASATNAPAGGFLLQSVDAPPYGGDTMFANLYLAYDDLSDGLKAICEQLVVVHSPSGSYGNAAGRGKSSLISDGSAFDLRSTPEQLEKWFAMEVEHPLVCEHHRTGRKYLYVAGTHCIRFKGWTPDESKPLLNYLQDFAQKPERICRFRWSKGAVALIDNHAGLHYALNDYAGFRREMYRVQFAGPPPVGPAKRERTAEEYIQDHVLETLHV